MWRLPWVNLFFVLILITFLALQHSAAVFAPAGRAYEPSTDNPQWARMNAAMGGKSSIAIGNLGKLWQRAMIMREWMIESQTASWERILAPRGAASDLLEARFHVANAEAFGSATGERQKAEIEFDRADRYLQKTLPLVTATRLANLNAIRKELRDAKLQLENGEPDSAAADERIKADLDRAIASLHGKQQ